MYHKLSNIAARKSIEEEFGINFKYPKVYQPNSVINGLDESTLSIVTMKNPDQISYGIWGILPEFYEESWKEFQSVKNTLNLREIDLEEESWYSTALQTRRCVIIVTGFFTSYINNGNIYPYYVYSPFNKPFCLAGLYNILEDGFITCSLIVSKSNNFIRKIENISGFMPVAIPLEDYKYWLDSKTSLIKIKEFLQKPKPIKLKAHTITKDFYKENGENNSVLNIVSYQSLPKEV
ncbi:SOS response-associated peptidase family protein [Abyssalbus ytuae]|uniref:Abasic site processing protein n=1 Tax=Abyssalbus ytuae TaxID=2926907 RepID=A0A9E6ZJI1_9FLAO|nr:SOS response-associated peptidase family protein [Abyssalbus ytuae]UOB16727.1 SOS response-associated peptidase [Abyssalbus ytuae]